MTLNPIRWAFATTAFLLTAACINTTFTPPESSVAMRNPDPKAYGNTIIGIDDSLAEKGSRLLGLPDFARKGIVSIGGSAVIIDMGAGEEIIDAPGDDLRIWETDPKVYPHLYVEGTKGYRDMADGYEVLVSTDLKGWVSLGKSKGTSDFDLASRRLASARYVKIVGKGNLNTMHDYPGPDIDAVEALHMTGMALPTMGDPLLAQQIEQLKAEKQAAERKARESQAEAKRIAAEKQAAEARAAEQIAAGKRAAEALAAERLAAEKRAAKKQADALAARQQEKERLARETLAREQKLAEREAHRQRLAAEARANGIAVIIGNRNYASHNSDVPDVDYAHRDAEAIRRFVHQSLGYRDENIIFLQDATQAEMASVFGNERSHKGKLFSYVKPGKSEVFVYYSGHGAPGVNDGASYLVPVNADPMTVELNGYLLETLYTNLGKIPAKQLTVVIDACFSGASASGNLVRNASSIALRRTETKATLTHGAIFSAAGLNEVASWDNKRRLGLFTAHFLDGVDGAADRGSYGNGDGQVTLGELKGYLEESVRYAARRSYYRDQHPQIHGEDDRLISVLR